MFKEFAYTGVIFALFFVLIYGFLFLSNIIIIYQKNLSTLIKNINAIGFQKSYKLFLLFIIPITVYGVAIRAKVITIIPMGVQIADMLPLIQKAGEVFIQGQNPYQVYSIPYKLPLTFWPGLWLPYLTAVFLDIDLRWIGIAIWIIISTILIFYTIRKSRIQKSPYLLILSSINILLLQISYQLISFQAYGHTFPLWLWLLIFCILLIEKKFLFSAIFLGIILSSRQTSIIYLPIILFFWYYQTNLITTIKYFLTTLFVFGLIILPFIINSPEQFFIAPILHYKQLGNYAMISIEEWTKYSIGFSYLIQRLWSSEILSFISYFSILIISVTAFFFVKSTKKLLIFLAASVTFFSFFTPIPWIYEYYPPLIFLSLIFLCDNNN
jgi:hypothetical protein